MKYFGLKSLKVKNSLIIISVMLPLLIGFLAYDLYRQSASMRTALIERGIILAQTGAETTGKTLDSAISNYELTGAQVFDTSYQLVPDTNPQKYHTAYDTFTDKRLKDIQDAYLKDRVIIYAVALDLNGYVPTHNTISKSGYGDNAIRSKRIFDDAVGLAAVQNLEPYLFQEYKRDTGETIWDISAPIYVNGRHWGGFRIGFSIEETNRQIAAIRSQIVGGGAALTIALIILIIYISNRITDTVKLLEQEAERVARGDLTAVDLETKSKDEMGNLTRSFGNMVDRLRQLVEKTHRSVGLVDGFSHEMQDSIQKAAGTAGATAEKMSQLSETMEKMREGSEAVAEATRKIVASLSRVETSSENFLTQMKSSSVVMTRAGESVRELESHVEKVGDIIQFIALIADQANLLAQKAVSEASLSSKMDNNFASLAAEIQKRSQDAAEATRGVASLFDKALMHACQASTTLEKDQQVVLEGYNAASEASKSLKATVIDLRELLDLLKEITTYTQQVSEGITSVNTALDEQSALALRFSAAAEMLDEVVSEMQEALASLKV